jgi:16S rRNA (cytosine1402-N4)-methyltransferase
MPPSDKLDTSVPDAAGDDPYATGYHAPVLCMAVVSGLILRGDGLYVDATLGGGGHTAALLEALGPGGRVIAIDRDGDAIREAGQRLESDVGKGRLRLVRGNFSELETILAGFGEGRVDGVLLDLGVSSHQLDLGSRGFSFRIEGPLDMRMDDRARVTAADLVNGLDEAGLRRLLRIYGEEPSAARIARAVVAARPVVTTTGLAEAVRGAVPGARNSAKALARVFQALRIAVNAELDALEDAIRAATRQVRVGGRLAIISYHSLEDRRVKRFIRSGNFEGRLERDLYGNPVVPWREVHRHALKPDEEEIVRNPRARSARLRIAERISEDRPAGSA